MSSPPANHFDDCSKGLCLKGCSFAYIGDGQDARPTGWFGWVSFVGDDEHRVEVHGRHSERDGFSRLRKGQGCRVVLVRGEAEYGFDSAGELFPNRHAEGGQRVLAIEIDEMGDGFTSGGAIEQLGDGSQRRLGGQRWALGQAFQDRPADFLVVARQDPLGRGHSF